MKEDFLHYIWKHKLVASKQLKTTEKEDIQLINVGEHNYNTGPDFLNAQVKIDNQLWAGTIEIHIKSSDWYVHGHEKDKNYDTVILHVVWEHDVEIYRKDNSTIPTLELHSIVNTTLLNNYKKLFTKSKKWINCENDIASVNSFLLNNWLERLYIERLEQKTQFILDLLKQSNNDWEAVLFKLLAKNFGLKVNGDAFFSLANAVDFSIIRKEKHNLENIEALFFGLAGFLNNDIQNGHYQHLQKEYLYLQKKHKLQLNYNSQIQFFRLRPNNFPTIRLSQLANLYHEHQNIFSKLMETSNIETFYKLFDIKASPFWDTHYSFESTSKKRSKKITKSFIDLVLINTIIPLKFVYQKHIGKLDEELILKLITEIKPEKNAIIDAFNTLKIDSNSAFKTQALLQLKNEYCTKQKCLHCAIGIELLTN